jgi:hypothetical protein
MMGRGGVHLGGGHKSLFLVQQDPVEAKVKSVQLTYLRKGDKERKGVAASRNGGRSEKRKPEGKTRRGDENALTNLKGGGEERSSR